MAKKEFKSIRQIEQRIREINEERGPLIDSEDGPEFTMLDRFRLKRLDDELGELVKRFLMLKSMNSPAR